MENILIFSGPGCGYCGAAKNLLADHGLSFTEIDISTPDGRAAYQRRLPRTRSIPQIFAGDEHIGGYDDLVAILRSSSRK